MFDAMTKKYALTALAFALWLGCIVGNSPLYHGLAFTLAAFFVFLLAFINRKNPKQAIIPVLLLIMLLGSFRYAAAASQQGSLNDYEGKVVTIEGVAAEEPIQTEYGQKFTLKNVYYINNGRVFKCNEKLLVYTGQGTNIAFGDRVSMTAELQKAAMPRNFGDFDFSGYYQSKKIFMRAYAQQITPIASHRAGVFSELFHNGRQRIKFAIYSAMPKPEADILYGILTGSKAEIDEDVMTVFSKTGLAHILSVSGLHIGFLVLMAGYILKPFRLKDKTKHIITFAAVTLYILLIGAPVPALRALLMFAVMLGGKLWGQRYDLNASASFAVILLLVYNPLLIHDPSFVISFACIYAISFFHQPIYGRLGFIPSWLRSSLSLSLAVWIGITPVLVHYFNYVSVVNILLNVAAVPLACIITIAGFVGVAAGLFLPFLSIFIFSVSYYLIRVLYILSEKASALPGAGFDVPALGGYVPLLYYGAAFLLIREFWQHQRLNLKRGYLTVLAAALLLAISLNILPGRSLSINFIDVGQGDCSVIKTPDRRIVVIDGGGNPSWQTASYDIGEKLTVPALMNLGVWRVDTLIISHTHEDHIKGTLSILEHFKIERVVLPKAQLDGRGEYDSENYKRFLALCRAKNIPVSFLQKGDKIMFGKDVTLSILGPEKPFIVGTDSDVNNNSLVVALKYKSFDALFTGDIQLEGEQRLDGTDLNIDVLKTAHHGSPYSTTEQLLNNLDPEFSIISVGKNNYGHPSPEVIGRLKHAGGAVYRTDECGGVMLKTDGARMRLYTVR